MKIMIKGLHIPQSAMGYDLFHIHLGFSQQTAGLIHANASEIFGKAFSDQLLEQTAQMGFADIQCVCDGFQRQLGIVKGGHDDTDGGKNGIPFLGGRFGNILDRAVDITTDFDQKLCQISTDGIPPFVFLLSDFGQDVAEQKVRFRIRLGVQHGIGENGVITKDAVAIARFSGRCNVGREPILRIKKDFFDLRRILSVGGNISVRYVGRDDINITRFAGNGLIQNAMDSDAGNDHVDLDDLIRIELRSASVRIVGPRAYDCVETDRGVF